jgi:SAM-dependent methyltransferase
MNDKQTPPALQYFEDVSCYLCGSVDYKPFIVGQDDLTGKPGDFQFVVCTCCGLTYQQPRLTLENIKEYYDDEYIAHRKKTDWGIFTGFYKKAMRKHDLKKQALVERYVALSQDSLVLDVGCGAGTFAALLAESKGIHGHGVDFKDLSNLPSMSASTFHCGLFYEQDFDSLKFDLITMWHYLEHDYDPMRSLRHARKLLTKNGRLIIEVPRLDSLSFWLYRERWPGLQAPQHTVLYTKDTLCKMVKKAGFEIEAYLPYGAFPPYFYLFTGLAFKLLKGRGLNLDRAIAPYVLGQVLLSPLLLFQKHLNLAMQTVVVKLHE